MPPSLEHSRAVAKINTAGLFLVASQHPNAVVFKESYTLRHVPVGTRLLICVFDGDGNNITPPDESRNFHSTDIVLAAEVSSMYMGPRTTCKDLSLTTSKQSAYTKAIPGDAASEKFFSELMRVFDAKHYAQAVKEHPVHSAKQGKFLKGGDAIKGIDALVRKGKLFTPIRESDDGVPSEVVMRRKVFSTRTAYRETGTDYDNDAVQQFCEGQNQDICVDPVPVFYADGSRCTEYDSIRSSSAAMLVYSLRPDWVNSDLGECAPALLTAVSLLFITTPLTFAAPSSHRQHFMAVPAGIYATHQPECRAHRFGRDGAQSYGRPQRQRDQPTTLPASVGPRTPTAKRPTTSTSLWPSARSLPNKQPCWCLLSLC